MPQAVFIGNTVTGRQLFPAVTATKGAEEIDTSCRQVQPSTKGDAQSVLGSLFQICALQVPDLPPYSFIVSLRIEP